MCCKLGITPFLIFKTVRWCERNKPAERLLDMTDVSKDFVRFSKGQKDEIVSKIRGYFKMELDFDINNLQAQLLLNFFSKSVGIYYYNQAIEDAVLYMQERTEDLYALQKADQFPAKV